MSKEYANVETSDKLPKLSNIYLSVEFLTDPKILSLLDEWGDKGLVALMALYFALAKERGAELKRVFARAVVTQRGWGKDDAQKFLESLVDLQILHADVTRDSLVCPRLLQEQSICKDKQLAWKERQRRKREKEKLITPRNNATDVTRDSRECLNNEYMNSESMNSSIDDCPTVSLETRGSWLKMLPVDWQKLEETYGPETTRAAALEADEWIDLNRSHDKNARKYSKPTYNNKLFLRNWIARKKTSPPKTNGHKPTTMEINREMFEQLAREEADERARKAEGSKADFGGDLFRVGETNN